MKRIITIIAIVVLSVSCTRDPSVFGSLDRRTQSGYALFEYADRSINSIAMLVTEAEIFNSYYKADTAYRRQIATNEDWFFNKTISPMNADSTRWKITSWGGYVVDITMKDGLSLSEIGAEWKVRCSTRYIALKNSAATFKRISDDTLLVTFSDGWTRTEYPFAFTDVSLNFVYTPEEVLLRKGSFMYELNGAAVCEAVGDREMTMQFGSDKLTGMTWYENGNMICCFYMGIMNVEASKADKTRNVSGRYGVSLLISYEGIAEQYTTPKLTASI